jgi:hypothetical protein
MPFHISESSSVDLNTIGDANNIDEQLGLKVADADTLQDQSITAIKLIFGGKEKGIDIPKFTYIEDEDVFDPVSPDLESETTYLQYFSYSKAKYYAIALENSKGEKVKVKRNTVTVTYQVVII